LNATIFRSFGADMPLPRNSVVPRLWMGLLVVCALDTAVTGVWAVLRPGDLFALLQQPPDDDGFLLCRALGLLYVTQALFVILAAFRPRCAGLALAPLLGRLLACGVWLWLMGSGRMPSAVAALLALLANDALWPPLLAAFLWARRPVTRGAAPGPERPAARPAPPA
jgi:hypothetical protein